MAGFPEAFSVLFTQLAYAFSGFLSSSTPVLLALLGPTNSECARFHQREVHRVLLSGGESGALAFQARTHLDTNRSHNQAAKLIGCLPCPMGGISRQRNLEDRWPDVRRTGCPLDL